MANSKPSQLSALSRSNLSIADIQDVIRNFPIGDRVRYFPEYQQQSTMRSVVLGYEINGHVIYKQNQIELGGDGDHAFIALTIDGEHHKLEKPESFCVILPGKAGEEGKLNYPTKAALGAHGQFRNGNSITLVARYQNSGIVTLDCFVRESIIPKQGVYRNHRMALLEVITTSLEIKEQRTHHRLQTKIPVKVQRASEPTQCPALLRDFSELHVQLSFGENAEILSKLRENTSVVIYIPLDDNYREFVTSGLVTRKTGDRVVVTLNEILEDGEFRTFELMDALNLKAALLQHPNTE